MRFCNESRLAPLSELFRACIDSCSSSPRDSPNSRSGVKNRGIDARNFVSFSLVRDIKAGRRAGSVRQRKERAKGKAVSSVFMSHVLRDRRRKSGSIVRSRTRSGYTRSPKVPIRQIRSIASDNAMRLIGIFSMTSNGLEVTQLPRENPAGGKLANKTPHQVQLRRCNRRRGPSAHWAWSGIGTIGTCHR